MAFATDLEDVNSMALTVLRRLIESFKVIEILLFSSLDRSISCRPSRSGDRNVSRQEQVREVDADASIRRHWLTNHRMLNDVRGRLLRGDAGAAQCRRLVRVVFVQTAAGDRRHGRYSHL